MGTQSTPPYDWLDSALTVIHKAHWYRSVREISGSGGPVIHLDGQAVINFASNDYLGLSSDDRVKEAAIAAIRTYGTGATGSRLLTGHRPLHAELEREIADWKQTDAALVFSSGYLANLTTIRALVDQRDLIMADEYNHSSLKNGAKLSGAQVIEFDHVNMDDLGRKLSQNRNNYRRCLILSDSVFSMDGDVCPLPALIAIAQSQDAMLLIDEAHATGVIGKTGSGCVEQFGCWGTPLIQVGTLSKALGSLGGYVAGTQNLIDYLRNRGAGWIYTTGLSPSDTAAALQSLRICRQEPERTQALWRNIQCFKQAWWEMAPLDPRQKLETSRLAASRLQDRGGVLLPSESAIACFVVHSPEKALDLSAQLLEHGYWVPAIRPPTVPTSRLRISLMATHSTSHIQGLVNTLRDLLEPLA